MEIETLYSVPIVTFIWRISSFVLGYLGDSRGDVPEQGNLDRRSICSYYLLFLVNVAFRFFFFFFFSFSSFSKSRHVRGRVLAGGGDVCCRCSSLHGG
jgi:hypothetical protein